MGVNKVTKKIKRSQLKETYERMFGPLNEFREDPKRGLGSDYKSIAKDAKKLPKSKVKKIAAKILKHPKYKNLTPDEAVEYASLLNVPSHSGFSERDLTAYFLKLSKSR